MRGGRFAMQYFLLPRDLTTCMLCMYLLAMLVCLGIIPPSLSSLPLSALSLSPPPPLPSLLSLSPPLPSLRIRIHKAGDMIIDSGCRCDHSPGASEGGKLGLYVFSQPAVIFSDMKYKCLDDSQLGEVANCSTR